MIGEAASRSSIELPGRQLELLQAVVATGTPTVLLVMNGRPLDLRWAAENVPAILDIWYPGTQGGAAVANLLFGDVAPGGKLPFSWPRTVGQVPMIYSHTTLARTRQPGPALLGRAQHPAVPVRARTELRPLRIRRPDRGPQQHPAGETVTVSVDRHQRRPARRSTRSPSSTSTSGTGPPPGRCGSSRASSASPSPPASPSRCGSSSGPTSSATGTPPRGTGSSTPHVRRLRRRRLHRRPHSQLHDRVLTNRIGTGRPTVDPYQIANQPAARSRASTGRSPAWTPWVAVTVTSTTPFGMACRTTKPMASTTSTKAKSLRCVPRRDGVSIGSSVAKPSRGWSVKSATSGQDAMARDAAQPPDRGGVNQADEQYDAYRRGCSQRLSRWAPMSAPARHRHAAKVGA